MNLTVELTTDQVVGFCPTDASGRKAGTTARNCRAGSSQSRGTYRSC